MANFTSEIRRDLLAYFPEDREGAAAAFAAFLATSGAVRGDALEVVSENERVAEYFLRLTEALGVRTEVRSVLRDPKRKKDKLTFACVGADAGRALNEAFGAAKTLPQNADAALWYVRAAFLSGGSCTLPRGGAKTGYHFECVFNDAARAEAFCERLAAFELYAKCVARGDTFVAYIKSREAISDALFVLGANGALKKFNAVSAVREANNNENRIQNCIAGNADKTAIASAAQTVAFRDLQRRGVLNELPEPLRKTALARLEHPTYSLAELCGLLNVSKGGLNHRIRKLMKLYEERETDQ